MMKWFLTFLCALFIYNFVYDTVILFKTNSTTGSENDSNKELQSSHKRTFLDNIVFLLSALLALAFEFILIWKRFFPPIIATVFLFVPVVLNNLSGAIIASNSLKTIVIGKNSDHELSLKEKFSIDLIAGAVIFVAATFPIEKFIEWIKLLQMNQLWIEAFLSIYILLVAFGLSFVVIVQLIVPFRHLKTACALYEKYVGKVWGKWTNYTSEKHENLHIFADKTKVAIEDFKRVTGMKKIMALVLVAGAFVFDIIVGIFQYLFSSVLCFFLQALLVFSALVGKLILYVIKAIASIPGRKVMKGTFRLSAIIAVLVVVIVNRLSIITKIDAEFLGISEFVASAIVIPIIFEWIHSGKERKENIDLPNPKEQK